MYVTLLLNFNAPPIPKVNHCVVVGNGQASIAQGHLIDQHDAVIRMNDAPTVGFEKYVGSKTTHRLVLNEHIGLEKVMRVDRERQIHMTQKNSSFTSCEMSLTWHGFTH